MGGYPHLPPRVFSGFPDSPGHDPLGEWDLHFGKLPTNAKKVIKKSFGVGHYGGFCQPTPQGRGFGPKPVRTWKKTVTQSVTTASDRVIPGGFRNHPTQGVQQGVETGRQWCGKQGWKQETAFKQVSKRREATVVEDKSASTEVCVIFSRVKREDNDIL